MLNSIATFQNFSLDKLFALVAHFPKEPAGEILEDLSCTKILVNKKFSFELSEILCSFILH